MTQKEFGFPKKHNLEVHAATTRSSQILFSPQPQPQSKPQSHPHPHPHPHPPFPSPVYLQSNPDPLPRQFFYCSASDGTNVVAAFEAAISKAIEYSKKPPEDFVDQASRSAPHASRPNPHPNASPTSPPPPSPTATLILKALAGFFASADLVPYLLSSR